MVARREARHLRALDPGVGAGVRARRRRDRRAPGPSRPARHGLVALRGVVRELLAVSRESRRPAITPRCTAGATTTSSRPTGRPRLDAWDPEGVGRAVRGHRRPLRRARDQAPRRLLPLAHRRAQPAPARLPLARATWWASWPTPCGPAGLRFGVYYSGGLDWTFNDHPIGAFSDLLAAQPRGDYVDYAEAHVARADRALRAERAVERHLVAGTGGAARSLARVEYYQAVPDGVVNDRFMPWSPLWEAARDQARPGGCSTGVAARSARGRQRASCRRSRRCSTCARPSTRCSTPCSRTPWECVRGIDRSFGHNRAVGRGALPRAGASCCGRSSTSRPRAATCC